MTPVLNWAELALLINRIQERLFPDQKNQNTLAVERIIVPSRPRFPTGYLKAEWCLRLSSRTEEFSLIFSVRPRHPYVTVAEGKGPRAAPQGTHSPFDLALNKFLKGRRVLGIETLPRERIVILWVGAGADPSHRYGLVLALIPAVPEAFLIETRDNQKTWPILTRSRVQKLNEAQMAAGPELFAIPDGSRAPEAPAVREALVKTAQTFAREVERALSAEAFELRTQRLEREIRAQIKTLKKRVRQAQTALQEAETEPDWQKLGDLMKSSLHDLPEISAEGTYRLQDYTQEHEVHVPVPADPNLSPSAQLVRLYQRAKRKARRLEETHARLNSLQEALASQEKVLSKIQSLEPGSWDLIEPLERDAGFLGQTPITRKREASWIGKRFTSKDGSTIFVGRNRTENLELTFKLARGNDLWMHVRGRPGAHAVIPLSSGKSASLETLLDAATLTVYYSGGEKWGKTEVDYTFRKHVKRIKDSTEVSYVRNKTILVEPEPARLKRLLGSEA